MKTIIVKWVKEEEFGDGKAMRVIESDHKRFSKGTRFYFGFLASLLMKGIRLYRCHQRRDNLHSHRKLIYFSILLTTPYPCVTMCVQ